MKKSKKTTKGMITFSRAYEQEIAARLRKKILDEKARLTAAPNAEPKLEHVYAILAGVESEDPQTVHEFGVPLHLFDSAGLDRFEEDIRDEFGGTLRLLAFTGLVRDGDEGAPAGSEGAFTWVRPAVLRAIVSADEAELGKVLEAHRFGGN